MKKCFCKIATLVGLLPLLSLTALGAQQGDFVYQTNGGGAVVTGYAGPGGAVVIPDTLGGVPVRMIGASAFDKETTVTSVNIPNSVTNIHSYAFFNCTSLSNVTLPNGLISIGDYAFVLCESLTNVAIGPSLVSIGALAFGYCDRLRAITVDPLNSFYTSVDGVLFDKNTNTLLQVPGGKSGSYTIPASVTNIAYGAFIECKSLTSVTIPDNVTSLGYSAFYFCSGLTNVSLPSTITSIGGDAFGFCTNLASLTIPSAVTSIGWGAFSYCDRLTSITIPHGVTNMGGQAFYGCTGLTNVTIGSGVTQIADEAFGGCASLTSITIPDSVTRLGFMAFAGCTGLRNVSIGNSVTIIEDSVFWGCTGLTSLTIPSSVTTIMDGTFAACTALTSLYFEGNAPAVPYPDWSKPFDGSPFVTVFYRAGTTGWGATYADRPTVLWGALSVQHSGTNVIVSWPKAATDFVLDESSALGPPSAPAWTQVLAAIYQTNVTSIFVTQPAATGHKFYRLRRP